VWSEWPSSVINLPQKSGWKSMVFDGFPMAVSHGFWLGTSVVELRRWKGWNLLRSVVVEEHSASKIRENHNHDRHS
jgi:hypothetical protein